MTDKKDAIRCKCKIINNIIGSRIRGLRLTSGLTYSELAEKIGVTHQQLYKYENGTNQISVGRLVVLSDHLGVNIVDLIPTGFTSPMDQEEGDSIRFSRKAGKIFSEMRSKATQETVISLLKNVIKLDKDS